MYKPFQRIVFFLFSLLITPSLSLTAQTSVSEFLNNYQWLDSKDTKNWEKQLELIEKADEVIQKSNNKYIEVYNIEKDAGLSEKKKQSSKQKLEEEAFNLSVDALKTYKEAYSTLFEITEKYTEGSKQSHPAYSEAKYYKEESDLLYVRAGKVKTLDEQKLLADANENLLLAVEKSVVAITVPSNEYKISDTGSSSVSDTGEDFEINNEIYQKYLEYINNDLIADPVTMQQLHSIQGEDVSYADFQDLWVKYNSADGLDIASETPSKDEGIIENFSQTTQDIEPDNIGTENYVQDEPVETKSIETKSIEAKKEEPTPVEKVVKTGTTEVMVSSGGFSMDESMEFRVQIAASKVQLNLIQLKAIYKGDLSLVEVKEGEYYKYQIRGFREVKSAQATCSSAGVSNAFIHAYRSSNRLELSQAVKEAKSNDTDIILADKFDFAIQVAASRTRLSQEVLTSIYRGSYPVSIVFEEGWYKYQILVGNNLSKAYEVLEESSVKKAFMVAYKNGKKQVLHEAIQSYKKQK